MQKGCFFETQNFYSRFSSLDHAMMVTGMHQVVLASSHFHDI